MLLSGSREEELLSAQPDFVDVSSELDFVITSSELVVTCVPGACGAEDGMIYRTSQTAPQPPITVYSSRPYRCPAIGWKPRHSISLEVSFCILFNRRAGFVTKRSPLFGMDGLIGVTWVLFRWSCNFSAGLEVSYFWPLSLANAALHLQILLRSDSSLRGLLESLGAAQWEPDLELVYDVSPSYPRASRASPRSLSI